MKVAVYSHYSISKRFVFSLFVHCVLPDKTYCSLLITIQFFVLSPEVFDIFNKLMKSDEDNATGDIQLLCKLFSGERCSYHYATEGNRIISQNTPFCILGSTQLLNAAKLIAKMDHGHGLVDRILFATPLAYRSMFSEMETAKAQL